MRMDWFVLILAISRFCLMNFRLTASCQYLGSAASTALARGSIVASTRQDLPASSVSGAGAGTSFNLAIDVPLEIVYQHSNIAVRLEERSCVQYGKLYSSARLLVHPGLFL